MAHLNVRPRAHPGCKDLESMEQIAGCGLSRVSCRTSSGRMRWAGCAGRRLKSGGGGGGGEGEPQGNHLMNPQFLF